MCSMKSENVGFSWTAKRIWMDAEVETLWIVSMPFKIYSTAFGGVQTGIILRELSFVIASRPFG